MTCENFLTVESMVTPEENAVKDFFA